MIIVMNLQKKKLNSNRNKSFVTIRFNTINELIVSVGAFEHLFQHHPNENEI